MRCFKRPRVIFHSHGICPNYKKEVVFTARDQWFRDHYLCLRCGSIPRERTLIRILKMFLPDWQDKIIHKSSPIKHGTSDRLSKHYRPSQLFGNTPPSVEKDGVRCENLESITFADANIDLHVTQDVMEHVLYPARVFSEIARTLKPSGANVFTVPIISYEPPLQ